MPRNLPLLLILIIAAAVLSPVLRADFLAFDDDAYVTHNPKSESLSATNIQTIFSETHLGQYVPLTLLFFALERSVFGLDARAFHAVNLLLHLVNICLVYLIFFRWSGYRFKALGAAALFALHPLSVEPVAWISSAKDMLYVFFFLLSALCYERFKDHDTRRDYVLSLFFGVLAILSKSAAVSLPILFAFLEWRKGRSWPRIARRIAPLALLSAAVMAVNVWATPGSMLAGPIWLRLLNVFFAPLFYLAKIFHPVDLSCIYPRPEHDPGGFPVAYLASPLLFSGLCFWVWKKRRVFPDLFFGAMIFLILSAPMLPWFRVGPSMVADRYAYLSATGVYFVVASAAYRLLQMGFFSRVATGIFIFFWFVILGQASFARAQAWQDGVRLLTDSVRTYPWSAFSFYIRGNHFMRSGEWEKAAADYEEAIRLRPDAPPAYRGLEEAKLRMSAS